MTTKEELLRNRGWLSKEIPVGYLTISFDQKVALLNAESASKRTLGARLLIANKTSDSVNVLLSALEIEQKLYPKIEICNTLAGLGEISIKPLLTYVAKIGTNQHAIVPQKLFLKDSYPLPRDIVSRTLIRIGGIAIPELLKGLEVANQQALSELIDAIGYINFYAKSTGVFESLNACYFANLNNDLLKWKIIRAMSGVSESRLFLGIQYDELKDDRLKKEIERSVRLIGRDASLKSVTKG